MLVLDLITELPSVDYFCPPLLVFCIWRRRDGLLTLTMLLTSVSLACIRATFDFTELYLKVILYLITSSVEAIKSSDNNSMNLYSMF